MYYYTKMSFTELTALREQLTAEIQKADIKLFASPYEYQEYKNKRFAIISHVNNELAKRSIKEILEDGEQLKKRDPDEVIEIDDGIPITVGSLLTAYESALDDFQKRHPRAYAQVVKKR